MKRQLADNEIGGSNSSKIQKVNVEESLQENVIRYCLMPSLKHMSAVKIIITLWSQADIQNEIIKLSHVSQRYTYSEDMNKLCQEVKSKIFDRILELSRFKSIRKILSDVVNPIGQEIFDWMEYQDRSIFCNDQYQAMHHIAVNYIGSLVWSSRGIIDYQETARILFLKKELSNNYKYNLACNYCLEDKIKIIVPQVLPTLHLGSITMQPMSYFWINYIIKNFVELKEEIKKSIDTYNIKYRGNYSSVDEIAQYLAILDAKLKQEAGVHSSVNEYLFQVLVGLYGYNKLLYKNQVVIKYIWYKFSDDEKSRNIITALQNISNTDLKCFFLSQMNEEQQQEVFKTGSRDILLSLLDDWLWKDYFLPTIHHIWNSISELDYLSVLENIVLYRMEQHYEDIEKYNQYKMLCKELWQFAPKHLKEFVFEFQDGSCGINIFFRLLHTRNIDLIKLMLPDINNIQKKSMIFSFHSINNKCHQLVISEQLEVLEMFISSALVSEEDINTFKQKFVKLKGHDIAVHFIQNNEWSKVVQFLEWAFKSADAIREFKQGLVYSKICKNALESIVTNNKADFVALEHYFKWCVPDSQNIINNFKLGIPKLYFREIICKLIEEGKYQLLEQILNWSFANSQQQIDQFKQHFYQYHDNFEIVELVINLVIKDNQLQSLEEFTHWCFTNEEEIKQFKEWILHPAKNTVGVCIELLCKDKFKLAHEFTTWCCNSSQIKINKFKSELMVCDYIDYLFEENHHDNKILIEIIKWFKPSIEIITQFKEKFINSGWFKDILPILDNSFQEQDHNLRDIENNLNNMLLEVESNIINHNDNLTTSLIGVVTED
ncbi:hypothetical protein [Rickettsia oklahomensis]|uniref:Uncharacterized protein n=1 Tax=Rickettsia oklahomensis TaxID=3141789 RepID=A0AAU7BYI5_9RICK